MKRNPALPPALNRPTLHRGGGDELSAVERGTTAFCASGRWWSRALDAIFELLRQFRDHKPDEGKQLHDWVAGAPSQALENQF